jgi:tetratricopeptide (TPR) repeat protein
MSDPTPSIPEYDYSLADRHGADASMAVRAVAHGLPAGALGLLGAIAAGAPGWVLVVAPLGAWAAASAVSFGVSELASRGVLAFLAPSGRSCPYQPTYSREEALAAAGDVDGALAAYERHIAAAPDDVEAYLAAAEMCARNGRPARAAELLAAARRVPTIPAARDLYATSRLVDLHIGPLADRGRAVVELRRLADRHPGTPEAAHAAAAMARLKAELFAGTR